MDRWRAVILAGGKGKRLWPLTTLHPKPLIQMDGIPLILYAVALLKRAGANEVLISVHHKARKIVRLIGNGERLGICIRYMCDPTLLGTGGALKQMESQLQGQPFVVINADTVLDIDVAELLRWHKENQSDATMVVRNRPFLSEFKPVVLDLSGHILAIRDSAPSGNDEDSIRKMFAGVQVLTEKVFDYLPEGRSDIISSFWQPAIGDGLKLLSYSYDGPWWEIGSWHQLINTLNKIKRKDFPAIQYLGRSLNCCDG